MAAKFLIKDTITAQLGRASIGFARRTLELSEGIDRTEFSELTIQQENRNSRLMEQTIGAVIVSVASIEGLINEILSSPSDRLVDKGNLQNVSDQAYRRWGRLWKDGAFDKHNALEKCQLALSVADIEALPRDRGAVQDLKLLISLRNEIVHSEPKYRADGKDLPEKERDKLERSLKVGLNQIDWFQHLRHSSGKGA